MVVKKEWYQMSGTPIKFFRTRERCVIFRKIWCRHASDFAEFGFSDEEVADLISSNTVLTRELADLLVPPRYRSIPKRSAFSVRFVKSLIQ